MITVKGYKENSAKGKGMWGKVRGNQEQASKSPLPVMSHRMFIPAAMNYEIHFIGYVVAQGNPLETQCQGFYWELVTQAASAEHVLELHTSRKKVKCSA